MSNQAHIYLIGDQTYDINKGLRDLLHTENDPLLTSFFEKSFYALREEIKKLPYEQRAQFQRFSSLTDLLTVRRAGRLHPAFDQALASSYQLGTFIRQVVGDGIGFEVPRLTVRSRCSKNGGACPLPTSSYCVGLCTGALSAAAISSCRSLTELLPVTVHTVVVAFRTGVCAVDIGRRIEKPSEDVHAPWSIVYGGLSLDKATQVLKTFSDNEVSHYDCLSEVFVT